LLLPPWTSRAEKFSTTGPSRFSIPASATVFQLVNKLSCDDVRPWPSARLSRPFSSPLPSDSKPSPWSRDWPRTRLLRTPSGFAPFRRLQSWKHGLPGLTSPSTFPSRRFARPQGFASPTTLQPCFMLLPPLGFRLQSLSHPNSRDRLRPSPHLTLRRLTATRLAPGHPAVVSSATPLSRSPLTVAPPPDSHRHWLRTPPSGSCSVRASVLQNEVVSPAPSRCSPGVPLLQGSSSRWPAPHVTLRPPKQTNHVMSCIPSWRFSANAAAFRVLRPAKPDVPSQPK
jgi:hypothetical protein